MRLAIIALLVTAIALASPAMGHSDSDTVELHAGWNLVAWTGQTVAIDAEGISVVYGWEPDSQRFERYIPNAPEFSTITHFETGEAYWILAPGPTYLDNLAIQPECPEQSSCPEPTVCPTTWDEECTEIRQHGMSYEAILEMCEGMGFPCTYEREELAATDAYLDAHCR